MKSQLRVRNGCTWKNNAQHNPCQQGAGASGFDNVYATLLDNAPPASAPPAVDWDAVVPQLEPRPLLRVPPIQRDAAKSFRG